MENMKYADDIVRAMDVRGSIEVPEDCFASEEFDVWMYGKEEEIEKRGDSMPVLNFDIDVNFSLYDEYEHLVATETVTPDNYLEDRNSAEANDYIAFIDNLLALLDYYDFDVYTDTVQWPSYYYYLRHNSQIAKNNVPVVIKLRVSQHTSKHKSAAHLAKIKRNTKQTLEKLKLPKSKNKQRYALKYVTVNNEIYDTYESALDDIELQVREWFKELHIPLDDYEYIGNWE